MENLKILCSNGRNPIAFRAQDLLQTSELTQLSLIQIINQIICILCCFNDNTLANSNLNYSLNFMTQISYIFLCDLSEWRTKYSS